jgi:hypothetical protein
MVPEPQFSEALAEKFIGVHKVTDVGAAEAESVMPGVAAVTLAVPLPFTPYS